MKIISAREAFDSGAKRYFTGVPCMHGHLSERYVCNGICIQCVTEKRHRISRAPEAARWRAKYPEKASEIKARYRSRNLEKVRKMDAERQKRIRICDPEREKLRVKRFKERAEAKKIELAGRERPTECDICDVPVGPIVFDHCHLSGDFRGWICDRCNKVLGMVKDDPSLLRFLAKYLEGGENGKVDYQAAA